MVLGIILTSVGIVGFIVFIYMAYKTAIKPIENEKSKIMRAVGKVSNKKFNLEINKKVDYLSDVPDETSYLFDEDETDILCDETDILCDETELLDEETTLLY